MTDTLLKIRTASGRTQRDFADEMGLPLRTYSDLERGLAKTRRIHMNAAYWAYFKLTRCFWSAKDNESEGSFSNGPSVGDALTPE